MVGITCPQCERALPTDTIRADAVFCPFCGWQGKYKPPVEEHSAVLAPGKTNLPETPVEEVFFTLRESIPRYIGSVIVMNTLLSAMIGGIAILVFLSIALAQHMPLFAVPVCAVMMFGIAWAFTSILTIPVMPYFTLFHRARRFEVKGMLLHVEIGRKQRTYDLSGHAWQRCGKVPMDTYGSYFRTRPRLKVVLNRHEYGLGFTEEAAAEWTRYFEAVGLKEESPVRWRPILAASGNDGDAISRADAHFSPSSLASVGSIASAQISYPLAFGWSRSGMIAFGSVPSPSKNLSLRSR